jgi:hypothetical protein
MVGLGFAFQALTGWRFENFKLARLGTFANLQGLHELNNVIFCGGNIFTQTSLVRDVVIKDCKFLNCALGGFISGSDIYYINCQFLSGSTFSVQAFGGNSFISCSFANNGSASISLNAAGTFGTAAVLLRNCTLSDATEFSFTTDVFPVVYAFDHDNTQGNQWAFHNGGTVNWQTTVFQGSDPGSWRTVTTAATRTSLNPIPVKIAEVACAASALVTVKAWVKKDHATNIGAAIYIEDALYNIAGVVATQTTKADDTNWEELTLTFTPTEAGVVPIFAKTWYIAGNSNSYVGSVTITQA